MPHKSFFVLLIALLLIGSALGCTRTRPVREGVDPDWTYRDAGDSLAFSSVWDEAIDKPAERQLAVVKGIEIN